MAAAVLCRVLSPFIWSTAVPTGQLGAPTGLLFEPPVFVNQGEWGTGEFHTLDSARGIVVGRDKSGWAVSTSGGRTWNATLLGETNVTTPRSGFGDAVVLPQSGIMHSNDAPFSVPHETYTDLDGPPTYFIRATPSGKIVTGPTGQNISYTGISPPVGCRGGIPNSPKACPLRTAGSATLRLPDGRVLSSMMGYFPSWGNENSSLQYALLAFVSSDGGYEWKYAGVIAANVTDSEEGPCENDLTMLKNGSVLCVFRTDGGDGQPCAGRIGTNCSEGGHRMAPYGVAVSNSTDFSTWLPHRLLPNATQQSQIWGDHSTNVGCARPKIQTMADGALLLAGGRPSGAKEDPMIWLNANGDAERWQPYSVSYWHNTLLNQSCCWRNTTPYAVRIWPFDAHLNGSQFPRQSTSYNSLIRTNGTHGFIVYSQWLHHHGNEWRAYSLPFRLNYTPLPPPAPPSPPPPPVKNVSCVEGQMQGGALAPAANMTLTAAIAACQDNRRCYGFTASVPFNSATCATRDPVGTRGANALENPLRDVLLKDAWGARRITKDAKYTSWALLHRNHRDQ